MNEVGPMTSMCNTVSNMNVAIRNVRLVSAKAGQTAVGVALGFEPPWL
jgi:hypothetical protein